MTPTAPYLSALYRYPVKSMAGESLDASAVTRLGLPFDRMWMVADRAGRFVTGRQLPQLVCLRATPAPAGVTLSMAGRDPLFVPNEAFTEEVSAVVWGSLFPAWAGAAVADAWLSEALGERLRFLWTGAETARRVRVEPDVPLSFADGFPLLLIGQGSLDDLSARVGRPLEMARFRPNLVVAGAPAFAEDEWTRVRIGDVIFRLVKPCERCVFTTVDPLTGAKSLDQEPLRTLARYRKTADGVLFGQNVIADGAGELAVGMPVEVLE